MERKTRFMAQNTDLFLFASVSLAHAAARGRLDLNIIAGLLYVVSSTLNWAIQAVPLTGKDDVSVRWQGPRSLKPRDCCKFIFFLPIISLYNMIALSSSMAFS